MQTAHWLKLPKCKYPNKMWAWRFDPTHAAGPLSKLIFLTVLLAKIQFVLKLHELYILFNRFTLTFEVCFFTIKKQLYYYNFLDIYILVILVSKQFATFFHISFPRCGSKQPTSIFHTITVKITYGYHTINHITVLPFIQCYGCMNMMYNCLPTVK